MSTDRRAPQGPEGEGEGDATRSGRRRDSQGAESEGDATRPKRGGDSQDPEGEGDATRSGRRRDSSGPSGVRNPWGNREVKGEPDRRSPRARPGVLGLRGKLIVAMVFITLAAATVVGVWTQRFTQQQFARFLDVETSRPLPDIDVGPLLEHRARSGSWAGVGPRVEALLPGETWMLFDGGRVVASNASAARVAGATLEADGTLLVVVHGGERGGRGEERIALSGGIALPAAGGPPATLFVLPREPAGDPAADSPEVGFVRRVSRMHYLGIGMTTLLALAFAWLLARRIVGPVERLTAATRALAAGDLTQRVRPTGDDEIAELARSFNAMAQTIERNEALRRRMVSDVAHELRTPLTHLRCRIETAQDGLKPLDGPLLDSLHAEIVHLARLVDDLQELALAEAGQLPLHPVELNAGDVIRELAATLPVEAQSPRLRVELAEPLPRVRVDPDRLRQVLRNLVENARRHTAASGTVTIAARAEDGRVVCEVRDDGGGIAPEHLDRVFERFYRTDPSRGRATGGAGLGLPIVKQLVSAWGGSIALESTPGQGTLVRFDLPTVRSPPG